MVRAEYLSGPMRRPKRAIKVRHKDRGLLLESIGCCLKTELQMGSQSVRYFLYQEGAFCGFGKSEDQIPAVLLVILSNWYYE